MFPAVSVLEPTVAPVKSGYSIMFTRWLVLGGYPIYNSRSCIPEDLPLTPYEMPNTFIICNNSIVEIHCLLYLFSKNCWVLLLSRGAYTKFYYYCNHWHCQSNKNTPRKLQFVYIRYK